MDSSVARDGCMPSGRRMRRFATIVVALGLAALVHADVIQKWRTPEGTLYFGDRPPDGSTKLGEIGEEPEVEAPPPGDEAEESERSASAESRAASIEPTPAEGEVEEDLGTEAAATLFREELEPYGEWVELPVHGLGWTPSGLPADWQPYTRGRWAYTEYGATWLSDEAWGGAPFHYGRWLFDASSGRWIWVPGRRWAPAWVSWRYGNGWVGWAPLPPRARWHRHTGAAPARIGLAPRFYCFVRQRSFLASDPRRDFAPPSRGAELLNATRNVTRYRALGGHVANESIPRTELEQALGRPIPSRRVRGIVRSAPRAFAPVPSSVRRRPPGAPATRTALPPASGATFGGRPAEPSPPRRERLDAERDQGAQRALRNVPQSRGPQPYRRPPRPPEGRTRDRERPAAGGVFSSPHPPAR